MDAQYEAGIDLRDAVVGAVDGDRLRAVVYEPLRERVVSFTLDVTIDDEGLVTEVSCMSQTEVRPSPVTHAEYDTIEGYCLRRGIKLTDEQLAQGEVELKASCKERGVHFGHKKVLIETSAKPSP